MFEVVSRNFFSLFTAYIHSYSRRHKLLQGIIFRRAMVWGPNGEKERFVFFVVVVGMVGTTEASSQ